ncbi:MAG: hypothetical protein JSW41_00415 [Candidatus Aenigmatarchaeota archaeon]|nr:MAG: hypothetical protein JSW41_00415 [Candidatus Aenigmarchaeota archaeon]
MGGVPVPWTIKMIVSVILDVIDMLLVPLDFICLGDVYDIAMAVFGLILWGPIGMLAAWEVIGFGPLAPLDLVPTMTLIGLTQRGKE